MILLIVYAASADNLFNSVEFLPFTHLWCYLGCFQSLPVAFRTRGKLCDTFILQNRLHFNLLLLKFWRHHHRRQRSGCFRARTKLERKLPNIVCRAILATHVASHKNPHINSWMFSFPRHTWSRGETPYKRVSQKISTCFLSCFSVSWFAIPINLTFAEIHEFFFPLHW